MDQLTFVAQQQWFAAVWVFGWVIVIVTVWHLRGKRRDWRLQLIHKERLAAMDKGIPLPELPGYEDPPRPRRAWHPKWPLAAGIILIFGGAGSMVALMLSGEDYHRRVWSMGLIPVFVGVGLILQYWILRRD